MIETKMADYWVSNPRKFCEVCKCWFGDNKASIEFHEGGRRHKQNVEKQLVQARKRSVENEKERKKTSRALDAIEQAAIQAYQRDLEVQCGGLAVKQLKQAPVAAAADDSSEDMLQLQQYLAAEKLAKEKEEIKQKIQENAQQKVMELQRAKAAELSTESVSPWQQAYSPEGHTYYYNNITGASQWEVPSDFVAQTPLTETDLQKSSDTENKTLPGEDAPSNSSSETKTASGIAGQKRSADKADVELSKTYQPSKRSGGPYGAWTTVAVYETQDEDQEDQQEELVGGEAEGDTKAEKEDHKHEEVKFTEKTISSSSTNSNDESEGEGFKGFSFKKRTGNKSRPKARQRTSDI